MYIAKDNGLPVAYMCGQEDHHGPQDGRLVGFGHLSQADRSIPSPDGVPDGAEFERINNTWVRTK